MDVYQDTGNPDLAAVRRAMKLDDAEELKTLIVGLALYHEDGRVVEELCHRLSGHADEFVRGNAVLGFGHLARRFRTLDERALAIVERALKDSSDHVRGQAWAAAGDVCFFLGWKVSGVTPEA